MEGGRSVLAAAMVLWKEWDPTASVEGADLGASLSAVASKEGDSAEVKMRQNVPFNRLMSIFFA